MPARARRDVARRARPAAHPRTAAVRRRRPLPARSAPVLRLDPRGRAPRADRQSLRPRARRPPVPPPRLPAVRPRRATRPADPARLPALEARRRGGHVHRRAAVRPPAAGGARAAPRRARARPLRRDAGQRARRLDGVGRAAAPVHVRLHLRRDVDRPVPLGLPHDGARGVLDAARPARAGAPPGGRPGAAAVDGGRRRAAHHLAAAVAGRDARADRRRGRGDPLAADARAAGDRVPRRAWSRPRSRPSTTRCSRAWTRRGGSPAR